MNIVTVTNKKYLASANVLAKTFRSIYGGGRIVICLFDCDGVNLKSESGAEYCYIPQDVPHAWNTGFYYFKTYTLQVAMDIFTDEFIYLDSRHRILSRPILVEETLQKQGRFFVQYPNLDNYKLKYLTTKTCLDLMCNDGETFSYWAAIQAYSITMGNKIFVKDFLDLMKNPNIAGPSNLLQNPDGLDAPCKAHRNDQSVLSALIKTYEFDQSFDQIVSSSYGDRETIEALGGAELHNWNHIIRGRQ